jgi:hypothetical protein
MKVRAYQGAAVAALLTVPLLAGCGTHSAHEAMVGAMAPATSGTHVMPGGMVMDDSQMPGMDTSAHQAKPSAAAAMICADETAGAVQRGFAVAKRPTGLASFSDQLYRCSYQLPGGELRLSVKDLSAAAPGQAYFEQLERELEPVVPIKGVQSFGFPAFETARGDVVFIKDHKTLWVDATRVATADLRPGTTRVQAAYGVAAAVIACWSE